MPDRSRLSRLPKTSLPLLLAALACPALAAADAALPQSGASAVSTVLGKKDQQMTDGTQACLVEFAYAGDAPQPMLWEEPCAKTSAGMIDRPKLEELGWWNKLDASARALVAKLPGGKVLYIEGEFSAAIYPLDETGTPSEIFVAD